VDPEDVRLAGADIGWITTVDASGRPQSSPVWFLWHEGAVLVATQPSATKVANLADNPAASFHLEGAGPGELVVTLEGIAAVGGSMPSAYGVKYAGALGRVGTTATAYLADFSATVRLVPSRVRMFRSL